jgi:hypothetical protein
LSKLSNYDDDDNKDDNEYECEYDYFINDDVDHENEYLSMMMMSISMMMISMMEMCLPSSYYPLYGLHTYTSTNITQMNSSFALRRNKYTINR